MKTVSQKIISISTAAILLAGAAAASVSGASAADMLADQPGELTAVEFGTGWYVRADLIGTLANNNFDSSTSSTVSLTGDQRVTEKSETNVFGAGIGMGYRLSNNFRIDANYEYLGTASIRISEPVSGAVPPPCTNTFRQVVLTDSNGDPFTVVQQGGTIENCLTADERSWNLSALNANAYYEFDSNILGLRPFIGAGIGVIRAEYDANEGQITCVAAPEERCNPTDGGAPGFGDTYDQEGERDNGVSYHLAPSLTAGLSYDLGNNLYLDTAYRYTKMISSPIYGGRDSTNAVDVPTDYHSIKVGLRYEIW